MYQLINATRALHIPSGTTFPLPPVESYGHDYQRWIDAGNTPEPADPVPVVVPTEVTMRQARRALHAAGLLPQVELALNTLPEPPRTAALIDWNYSKAVQRHNGFVSQVAPLLGISSAQLDALFTAAALYAE